LGCAAWAQSQASLMRWAGTAAAASAGFLIYPCAGDGHSHLSDRHVIALTGLCPLLVAFAAFLVKEERVAAIDTSRSFLIHWTFIAPTVILQLALIWIGVRSFFTPAVFWATGSSLLGLALLVGAAVLFYYRKRLQLQASVVVAEEGVGEALQLSLSNSIVAEEAVEEAPSEASPAPREQADLRNMLFVGLFLFGLGAAPTAGVQLSVYEYTKFGDQTCWINGISLLNAGTMMVGSILYGLIFQHLTMRWTLAMTIPLSAVGGLLALPFVFFVSSQTPFPALLGLDVLMQVGGSFFSVFIGIACMVLITHSCQEKDRAGVLVGVFLSARSFGGSVSGLCTDVIVSSLGISASSPDGFARLPLLVYICAAIQGLVALLIPFVPEVSADRAAQERLN